MTEPQVHETEQPEAAPESDESKSGRGRPRPDTTVQRDSAALTHFQSASSAGLTREELAEKLGVSSSEAYLAIYRLSRQNPPRVRKQRRDGKVRWVDVDAPEAPAEPTPASESTEAPAPEPAL